MKRHYYLIIFLLLTIASCREKPLTINKFIYYRVYGIVYDSLDKPYLGLTPYFEYNKENKIKVAYGKRVKRDSITQPFGLTKFSELESDGKTIEIINKTLCSKSYDSTYNQIDDARCTYFLYETSDNKKRLIAFGKGGNTPSELLDLLHYIENLWYPTDRLVTIEPFKVDSMVVNFQKELFLKHPPLPRQNLYIKEK